MKKIINRLMIAVGLLTSICANANEATVTVETAGGLKTAIEALSISPITSLTIKGQLNADDIATLSQMEGKLSSLSVLNLENVTLVPGDTPYYSSAFHGDAVWHTNVTRYFIGTERKHVKWTTGLSQNATNYDDYYDYNLAGAFQNMPLTRIVLPAGINEIGREEFKNCELLTEIVMSNAPVFIGESACNGCVNLRNIPTLSNVSAMEKRAFIGCAQLCFDTQTKTADLQKLDSIPTEAFYGCSSMERVKLSPTLSYVKEQAFFQSGLVSLVLPNGFTKYGSASFANCNKLTEVQLPDNLYKIPYNLVLNTPYYNSPDQLNDSIIYIGNIAASIKGKYEELVFKPGTVGIADNFNGNTEYEVNAFPRKLSFPESLHYIGLYAFMNAPLEMVSLPSHVYEINDHAFYNCSQMNITALPSDLQRIGKSAFAYCAITEVSMPDGLVELGMDGFRGNSPLRNVNIGRGLRSIPPYAFYECSAIEELVIPDNIEEIGGGAFYCPNLRSLYLGKGLKSLGSGAFVTDNLEVLDYEAENCIYRFKNCTKLTQVTLGAQVKTLNPFSDPFSGCSNIKTVFFNAKELETASLFAGTKVETVTFGPDVKIIPDKTFYYCEELKDITLPEVLLSIGKSAFSGCSGLKTISIPKSVTSIGNQAFGNSGLQEVYYNAAVCENGSFSYCEKLTKAIVGPDVQIMPFFYYCPNLRYMMLGKSLKTMKTNSLHSSCSSLEEIFYNIEELSGIERSFFSQLPALRKVVFGPDVRIIPRWGFSKSESLEILEFSDNVKKIGGYAFFKCPQINAIALNEGLEEIGEGAFEECAGLEEIHLSSTVQIKDFAFSESTNIRKITSSYPGSPIPIADTTFSENVYEDAYLYVPTGTTDLYRSTWSWKNFINIVEYDVTGIHQSVEVQKGIRSIYNLNGTKTNDWQGLKIVISDDGTVKKLFHK